MVRVNGRLIHFGARYYEDFTTHGYERRKANYLARHNNEDRSDETAAGFWAQWLLWNKPTMAASARDVNHRFDLGVHLFP